MIKISFLGDIMCQKELVEAYRTKDGFDFSDVFEHISPLLKQSDYVIGNLETPVSIDNSKLVDSKYEFNAPIEFAQAIREAGINFVSTANNHCLDRGLVGLESTIESLDKVGLAHSGTFLDKEDNSPFRIDLEETKIGILAYTYGTNAFGNHNYLKRREDWKVNLFQHQELWNPITRFTYKYGILNSINSKLRQMVDSQYQRMPVYERKESSKRQEKKLLRDIDIARKNVDIAIVVAHMGGQYNREPDVNTLYFSELMMNSGVDIISGSHEHVVHRGQFINKSRMIAYSLGNFLTIDGIYSEPFDCKANYSIVWHVYIDKKKIQKTSFSVVKCVESPNVTGGITIMPATELLQFVLDGDKGKIHDDILDVAKKFSGIEYWEVYEEFPVGDDEV